MYIAAGAISALTASVALTFFVAFVINHATVYLQQQQAKEKTKSDVKKVKRFRSALDAVDSTSKQLGGPGFSRQGAALSLVDTISGFQRYSDPDRETLFHLTSIPRDFDNVISPAIAYNKTDIKEVVKAIHTAAKIIQGMEQKEIDSYITQVRKECAI